MDRDFNFERARVFLDEIIRNNAAVYSTELNSWSHSYYLNNARFRLVEAYKSFSHNDDMKELEEIMQTINESLSSHIWDAPKAWVICFHALRLMLDILERDNPCALYFSSPSPSP
jgi:hypothetical protein